ncbi:MAG TPA: hypothetical protein VIM88_01505 [Sulfurovum sp.]|uniref:hypothetical protein n=1 Tax=Sulfurovum sp. TaxID=1969726 RepID=UPI002F931EF9
MKALVEYLNHKNIIFRSLKEIMPKALGSRKKVSIHLGVELKENYYAVVMEVAKKSRVLRKEASELMLLHEKLEQHIGSRITKKYIIIRAPLCSQAKTMLEEEGWKVWHEER